MPSTDLKSCGGKGLKHKPHHRSMSHPVLTGESDRKKIDIGIFDTGKWVLLFDGLQCCDREIIWKKS